MSNSFTKWQVKFPRKPRDTAKPKSVPSKPLPSTLLPVAKPKPERPTDFDPCTQRAAAPADFQGPPALHERVSEQSEQKRQSLEHLAARMAVGRSPQVLAALVQTNLFKTSTLMPASLEAVQASRGLTATLNEKTVFIADTFFRRKVLHADVAYVRPSGDLFTMGSIDTVKADELKDVRFELVVHSVTSRSVTLKAATQKADWIDMGAARTLDIASLQPAALPVQKDIWIQPLAAASHTETCGTEKSSHKTIPLQARAKVHWVLDIPSSMPFVAAPHRCLTCQQRGNVADSSYFPVLDGDVQRAFPHTIVVKSKREKKHYMTRRYLLEILLQFYCTLNAREVRRGLVNIASANVLNQNIAWQMQAVPKSQVLREVVLRAFGACLADIIVAFQQNLFLYNAQGIRHDGNQKLPRRVVVAGEREYKIMSKKRRILGRRKRAGRVALAFTGLDGSLLAPPKMAKSEAWEAIDEQLQPLLESIKRARLAAHCPLLHCFMMPCNFSTTDVLFFCPMLPFFLEVFTKKKAICIFFRNEPIHSEAPWRIPFLSSMQLTTTEASA